MKIEDFDKIYCINLEKRKDRKNECEKIFKQYNINAEFVNAVDGNSIKDTKGLKSGAAGCCLSHKKIYQMILENKNIKKALILEDDIEFHPKFKSLFNEYYNYVPKDWQLLFFGGSHNLPPKIINKYVHKLKKTFTTHCYALKSSSLNYLMEQFSDSNIFNLQADVHLYKIQKKISCYGFRKHIAWQRESYSDIENSYKNYDFLK